MGRIKQGSSPKQSAKGRTEGTEGLAHKSSQTTEPPLNLSARLQGQEKCAGRLESGTEEFKKPIGVTT
jgi:hypothetical protein